MTMKRTLTELLNEHARSTLENVHVSIPGIVQSYDSGSQTCSVLPGVKKPLLDIYGVVQYESHPVISNVPVAFPHGATFGMHWELQAGDAVWLVYSELSVAEFLENAAESQPADVAAHSMSSPVAIPSNITTHYQTLNAGKRIGIDNDDAQIDFATGKIKVIPSATLGAARKTDPVAVTISDAVVANIAGRITCSSGTLSPVASLPTIDATGTITNGSAKVDIG